MLSYKLLIRNNFTTVFIPSNRIKLIDAVGMLPVMNLSLQTNELPNKMCIARVTADILENVELDDDVKQIINMYPECTGENYSLLSNVDIEMHLELTSTVPINYKPYLLSYMKKRK